MAVGSAMDKYANVLYDSVTASAADTLTFETIDVGLNIFDKVGLLVTRLEYTGARTRLIADGDAVEFGLSQSNGWTDADPSEPSIIDYNSFYVTGFGTPGNALSREDPFIKDFSTLPGGGMLITPKPLYLFVDGNNLAAAPVIKIRMFFTVIKLKPEEYFELLEARQYFG